MTLGDLIGHGKQSLLDAHLPALVEALDWIGAGIDLLAIAVMLLGVVRFVGEFGHALRAGEGQGAAIDHARIGLGRFILTGLELLIVSDIMATALSLQLADLLFLGLLVAIRSVVSFFLEREIAGLGERDAGR